MAYKYTYQGYNKENMARVVGISLPISAKQAYEICNFIKHKKVDAAKNLLNRVLKMKQAVPFKRYNQDVAHKPGICSGRYPVNSTKEILKLLESVEANANNKGLSNDLYITHMASHRAAAHPRSGRVPGEGKRAHVEIVVEQKKESKESKK